MSEMWEKVARVAKGLQLDDPVNWPHYADEAKCLYDDAAQFAYEMLRHDPEWDEVTERLAAALGASA